MKESQQLILANMAWAAEQHHFDPEFFTRQMRGQRPEFLWIGCSDSRVAPDQITQSPPGGLYILMLSILGSCFIRNDGDR